MTKQKMQGPNLNRAISGDVAVVSEETRTFDLSFASEDVQVLRRSYFDEPWYEVLGLGPNECDLSRIGNGNAPLLWGHDQYERGNNIGVIEKAWLKDGRGYATCRLSMRDDLAGLWQDIKDKILTNVSVGYQTQERTLAKQNEEGPDEYRVTRWLPLEISLVSISADDTVGVGRSAVDESARFTITDATPTEERSMSETVEKPAVPAVPERQAPAVSPTADEMTRSATEITQRAVVAERTRVADINDIAKRSAMPEADVDKAIREGTSVEAFRAAAFDAMASRETQHRPQITLGVEEVVKQRGAAEAALMFRMGERTDAGKPIDLQGNDFRNMSLLELCADRLAHAGVSTRGMDKMEITKRAITHSTSDFPILLQNVLNKTLLAAYTIVPDTWRLLAKIGSVSDFKASNRYRGGAFGDLDTIPEGAEYKYGTIGDGEYNPVQAQTKGKMFSVTRQLLINDDIGALTNIVQLMGRGAARTIEKDFYAMLLANSGAGPTMQDTGALFNTTAVTTTGGHANLLASGGTAPTVAAIAAMQQAMLTQSYNGDYIDVGPSIFLGPVDLAEAVKVLNASAFDPADNKFQKPNQVRGLFSTIIGTPRLTGTAWYTFADPNVEPVFEVDFLNGQQTPYTEQREGWNVDGIEYKVRLDYGMAPVGFRGARKNPGA